ncbi:basic amino acid ABC transporter substrate-binding protein [Neobacillus sp. MM2021_6]|uniref:basic amino acid ABC transporter substrate-binding protein n=1 Tax=Bacillaceae TaxID=186817 RepID=UPI001408F1C9|nr:MULTISPECIES: basic amino acid ABC transporter substrate-binding protein [Bacillaceae]MBO0959789.1 basic amino acid ABC transporter substrate-binding protein [Neobacillus sp. MM2021_6]NHC20091.1 basic amino acid ABC transporter substrate-binding protein [Bacillus sp. MM2020_4]WML38342.1 basic amino acid ABC transporter substrate-binding protein [Neobacillus sp. OS1-2]
MKKFKFVSTVLMVAFLLLLSACGTSKSSGEEKKTLRVVTDAAYAPFEYQDKGEVVGFDVDFVKAVIKEAGYGVKVEHVGWDPIFVEIEGKTADVAVSAITITPERQESYDFTVPYFLSKNEILVPKGSTVKSAKDLEGKKIAVQNGTTAQTIVENLYGKNNDKLKKFENNNLAILELKNGGVDAVVADNTVVETYVKNNPKDNFEFIEDDTAFDKEFYGLLLPKGSKLKGDLDKAVKKVIDNGTYAKLYKKWFDVEPDVQILKDQQ